MSVLFDEKKFATTLAERAQLLLQQGGAALLAETIERVLEGKRLRSVAKLDGMTLDVSFTLEPR